MKKSLFALAAIASLGLFAVGCGDGEGGDACITDLDCNITDGFACNVHTATCQEIDACYQKDSKFCVEGYTCNPTNGECVLKGSDAEDCRSKGCEETATCVEDNEGVWGCMPNDTKCTNNTVWNNSANGGKGGCIDEDSEVETCEDGSDLSCSEGLVCNKDTKLCEPRQTTDDPRPYVYVKIDDLSPVEYDKPTKEDPGVDIDAIVLKKSAENGGGTYYAAGVSGYARGDGKSTTESTRAYDPEQALGQPDSFLGYPNDMVNCQYYKGTVPQKDTDERAYTFVSLGGEGGYLIVNMDGKIEQGDSIDIIELSDCTLQNTKSMNGQKSNKEDIGLKVQVSTGRSVDSEWTVIGSGQATAGVLSAVVPELKKVYFLI